MRTWSAIVLGLLIAAAIGIVVWKGGPPPPPTPAATSDAGAGDAAADAGTDAESDAAATADAGAATAAEDAGEVTNDAGGTLLNGEAAPPLTDTAPKSVVFGVILVTHRGAQGAPPNARTREEALDMAKQLAEEAKKDFKAALAKGDKGSMENAGRMPRGMLEPAPEYVLFSLPKGGVSEPVETPRGFWIVQRIE